MYIEKCLNNGTQYLRLVKSQRILNNKGIKTVRKKIVFNIGPLTKFDDGKPDFVDRLKKSYKAGNPIIESLKDYIEINSNAYENYHFSISEGSQTCIGHPKKIANILIERILEDLGVIQFSNRYKSLFNSNFDLLGFIRLLIYGRILSPSSKIGTINQNDDYLDTVIKDPYNYNIYDTLDFVHKYKKSLLSRINNNLVEKFNRKTDLVYYDVTNFFFEIENPDEDIENNDNTITKGLRKNGVCKEERKLPIVQMGLFMDDKGLPISIEIFPGNTLDHQTVKPALESSIDNLNMPRFIFVGDRGICESNSLSHLKELGHGWVVAKSIAKSKQIDKNWIFDEADYVFKGNDFKYKSKIETRTINKDDGSTDTLTEKIVVYWSKSFFEKQKHENKSFIDFIQKLKKNPANFKITSTYSKMIKKFLKADVVNIKTGELVNSKELLAMIDDEKIKNFEKEMGYYQIISSELNKDDLEIINIYHGLSRIEDQFRTMKGTLDTRPLFVRTPEHIEAHLTICMIALTVVRIIQNKIVEYQHCNKINDSKIKKDKISRDKYWEAGLSGDRIQNALNKWTVEILSDGYYRFNDIDNTDLKLILDSFNINIDKKLYTKQALKSIKSEIKIIQ
ncbi:MAG: IS1634 family transposase [Clostridia bacterium]